MSSSDALPDRLPGRCTAITTQKKNKNRASLFIDDEFFSGFYREILIQSGIKTGDIITDEKFKELKAKDSLYQLEQQMYRWLANRNHSRVELKKKALAKGYSVWMADQVLDMLSEKKYINDEQYAEQFISEKIKNGRWGPKKIRAALINNGVKKQYIDNAFSTRVNDEHVLNSLKRATKSTKNRILRLEPGLIRKKKLAETLLRRGFAGETVFSHIDSLLTLLEDEEI